MATGAYSGVDTGTLRKEKETALFSMGKLMHKLVRDGKVTDEACFRLSERIAQIDAEVSRAEGGNVPGQGEGICPNCKQALGSPMDTFCGACGTNIIEYYSRNMASCNRCGHLTPSGGNYCTVCGVRRTV